LALRHHQEASESTAENSHRLETNTTGGGLGGRDPWQNKASSATKWDREATYI
jgi:hypothetical protein